MNALWLERSGVALTLYFLARTVGRFRGTKKQQIALKTPLVDVGPLALTARTMVGHSLQSLVRHDLALAVQVCEDDDLADAAFKRLREELLQLTQAEPSRIFPASYLLLVAVYLERIADHATNIAERVYYVETGDRKPLGRREARPGE